mmetsp:Transcript_69307/g.140927  ORF Transcript_69307/g.140927 Transcript_69307/m.140927 type:complete len:233 (-) Transcript_69307:922-1620(-)
MNVSFRFFDLRQCEPPLRVPPVVRFDRLVQPAPGIVGVAQLVCHTRERRQRETMADRRTLLEGTPVRAFRVLRELRAPVQVAQCVVEAVVGRTVLDSLFQDLHRLGNLPVVEFVDAPGVIRVGKRGVFLDGPLVAPNPVVDPSLGKLQLAHPVPQPRVVGEPPQALLEGRARDIEVALVVVHAREPPVDAGIVRGQFHERLEQFDGQEGFPKLVGFFRGLVELLHVSVRCVR